MNIICTTRQWLEVHWSIDKDNGTIQVYDDKSFYHFVGHAQDNLSKAISWRVWFDKENTMLSFRYKEWDSQMASRDSSRDNLFQLLDNLTIDRDNWLSTYNRWEVNPIQLVNAVRK